jgi:hypothetical protein
VKSEDFDPCAGAGNLFRCVVGSRDYGSPDGRRVGACLTAEAEGDASRRMVARAL